jgi:hypothetical protein
MMDPTGGVLSSNPAVGGSAADESAWHHSWLIRRRTGPFVLHFSSCRRGDVSSRTLNNCDLFGRLGHARTVHRVI